MNINVEVKLNLKVKEVTETVGKSARLAMRDTVVLITHDAVEGSPWKTGNNRRSIGEESSGFETGEGIIDQSKIEGAVYSTSGYGGYLETGTWKMAARPYFKPALDRNFSQEKFSEKMKEHLNEFA